MIKIPMEAQLKCASNEPIFTPRRLCMRKLCDFEAFWGLPRKFQSQITFSYELTKIWLRYPWKRNSNALPMSLFSPLRDYVWRSNLTLKHSGVWFSMLQSQITSSYGVTKIWVRYSWKRNSIALPMSLFSPLGD